MVVCFFVLNRKQGYYSICHLTLKFYEDVRLYLSQVDPSVRIFLQAYSCCQSYFGKASISHMQKDVIVVHVCP